jgi:hypothetical protein
MPQMKMKDLSRVKLEDGEGVITAEECAYEWIDNFIADVQKIEAFFLEKKKTLINEFIAT